MNSSAGPAASPTITPLSFLAQRFVAHWCALPKPKLIPSLSDYLDRADPQLQPLLSLVDVHDGLVPRVRLLGTGMVDLFGSDTTGQEFSSFMPAHLQTQLQATHTTICSWPCGLVNRVEAITKVGLKVQMACVGLPLMNGEQKPSCVVWLNEPSAPADLGDPSMQVSAIQFVSWVDLGAGIPDTVP